MAISSPVAVTALPTAPSSTDPTTFDARADALLAALPTFRSEINNVATNVYNNALDGTSTRLTWAGSWSNATAYSLSNVITYNNAAYICILAHTNQIPTNTTYWTPMVLAGNVWDPSTQSVTVGGTLTISNALRESKSAVAASNIDVSLSSIYTKTISANTTFTLSNVPTSGKVASFMLELTNPGAYTITWWSGIKWPYGIAPSLTVSGVDTIGFYTHDGGTTWRGIVLAKDSR